MSLRIYALSASVALASLHTVFAQNPSQQGRETPAASTSQTSYSGDEGAYFEKAEAYEAANNKTAAIGVYRGLIKNYPASSLAPRAQYRIAELYLAQGNASKAFDNYQTLITRYPDTSEFEKAVAQQVVIANEFLQGRRMVFLGMAILPGTERAQKMYEAILQNAPYSKHAPIAQFNLGLAFERQNEIGQARKAYQTVLDKYPNSDVCDDALYQIAYVYMISGLSGNSQDLSSLILAKETYEDFLLQYPRSEKVAQARENLQRIGADEASDLLRIAKYYDWSRNYKAAIIYYNDIVRKQPKTPGAEFAKTRIEELRGQVGDDALRVGSEKAESGEKLALRRRLQAQVETSSLSDYAGPSRRDIVPDELPVVKQPRLRTESRDVQPLPAPVEPLLPTQ